MLPKKWPKYLRNFLCFARQILRKKEWWWGCCCCRCCQLSIVVVFFDRWDNHNPTTVVVERNSLLPNLSPGTSTTYDGDNTCVHVWTRGCGTWKFRLKKPNFQREHQQEQQGTICENGDESGQQCWWSSVQNWRDFWLCFMHVRTHKDSYSTANEDKRQFNRFIIYCLNIVPMVNDSFWAKKKVKK